MGYSAASFSESRDKIHNCPPTFGRVFSSFPWNENKMQKMKVVGNQYIFHWDFILKRLAQGRPRYTSRYEEFHQVEIITFPPDTPPLFCLWILQTSPSKKNAWGASLSNQLLYNLLKKFPKLWHILCLVKGFKWSRCIGLDVLIPKIYICLGQICCYQSVKKIGEIFFAWLKDLDGLDVLGLLCWFQKYIYVWVKYAVIIIYL